MATLMDFPVILLTSGELKMPFSDPVKYCLLGLSVLLLLVAVGIMLWQLSMCCAQTQAKQDTASNLPYPDDMSSTPGSWPGIPNTKVEDVCVESHRLSRYLSLGSSESILSDGDGSLDEQANQETQEIHGSLRFSLYYDQLQSRLVVTILQAEGLHGRNQTRSLHPFVKLRLMQAGSEEVEHLVDDEGEGINRDALWTVVQEWQTRIVKNSSNPLFGEQFICSLQQLQELHQVTLRMEVRDFDKFSRHVILGEVRVPLGEFKRSSYPLELQEDLQTPQKDPVGDVLLSLKFLPTSQRLEVGFLKIRTPPIDTHTDTVLNARISLQCNQCKRRHQKTSAVPRRQVTVFNQVLMFSLPDLPLQECHILVSVYQSQAATRKSPKHLIGQLNIRKGRSSEDQHWSLMMQSVRQPIAKWHLLLI